MDQFATKASGGLKTLRANIPETGLVLLISEE